MRSFPGAFHVVRTPGAFRVARTLGWLDAAIEVIVTTAEHSSTRRYFY